MFRSHSLPPEIVQQIRKIRTYLSQAMLYDRFVSLRQLEILERKQLFHKDPKSLYLKLSSLENLLKESADKKTARLIRKPKISYPMELPISSRKNDIIELIKTNQVVIISGETGCGKSTQIPKMCLEAGRGINGKIALTQPRRIAAITIAHRIAEEMKEKFGHSVGYKIRFRDQSSPDSYIKVLTDGMLLAETLSDPKLYEYDTFIIDEAHERSLNIDFLLGLSKTLLETRKELKVIITSATIDTEKFSLAFNNAPVVKVGGRLFPVEVEYKPFISKSTKLEDNDYVSSAVKAVEYLKTKKKSGDILVFMPTEQDILETCEKLEGRKYAATTILPLYARLPGTQQGRVYSVLGQKIVVATNVAETSLTIPGIKYVIDTGFARISQYLPGTRTNSLPISPISKSSANQRMGRCGRVQEGLCLRLFTQEDYETRLEYTQPEIMRSNLAEVILRMIFLNLGHPAIFPFVDKPHSRHIKDGFDTLLEIGAISKKGRNYTLTNLGHKMARIPLDPRISRMLIRAQEEKCVEEVAIIASALSIRDPRERPLEKAETADRMHAPFKDDQSDFLILLNIWNRYHSDWEKLFSQNKKRKFCREHFLSFPRMREWVYIHNQVLAILKELRIHTTLRKQKDMSESLYTGIHRSILSGYLSNIAVNKEKNIYTSAKEREVMVFPGSTLFNKTKSWIVAAEMVKTSRLFARMAARIEKSWLEKLGGDLCRYSYSGPRWDKDRGEVIAMERVTLYGLEVITNRQVSYGKINPSESHEIFIQTALVEGNVQDPPPFLKHNLELTQKLSRMEDKLRKRKILVSEEMISDFYSTRVPGIFDIRSLEKKIKDQGQDNFLKMTEKDLLLSFPDPRELAQYPDYLKIGGMEFTTDYCFAPGDERDGVTLKIPARLLSSTSKDSTEWGIPGLYTEKISALIKGLPKRYRKKLVPINEKIETIIQEIKSSDKSLYKSLSDFIRQKYQVLIPWEEWEKVSLPRHLQLRFAVVDDRDKEIRAGRNLSDLIRDVAASPEPEDSVIWAKAKKEWERSGITSWDFKSLPERIPVGSLTDAFPGFETTENGINLRLFKNQTDAIRSHKQGVQILLLKIFSKDLKFVSGYLLLSEEYEKPALYFGGRSAIKKAMLLNLKKEIFQINLRSRSEFQAYSQKIGRLLFEISHDLHKTTLEILDEHHRTRSFITSIESTQLKNKAIPAITSFIRSELDFLVPKDFLFKYPLTRLRHFPRYLKTIQIRMERAKNDPEKDKKKATQVNVFIEKFQEMEKQISSLSDMEKLAALEEFRWMIEEFKVSLFAPELKTPYPVSIKRLVEAGKKIILSYK